LKKLKKSDIVPFGEPVDFKDFKDKWEWRKKQWWYPWSQVWWWIRHGIWQKIGDIPNHIKWFFQRGLRGYSDFDLWGTWDYLGPLILNMLVDLKRIKHGTPATEDPITGKFTGDADKDYDEKRWDEILDKMIRGFAIIAKIQNGELEVGTGMSDEQKAEMNEHWKKEGWGRFTTKEEEEQIQESFRLLGKHFFSLWD
jgi:hypothetical protein